MRPGSTGFEFAGELSLAGDLRPVRGALAMALALRRSATERVLVLPQASAREAALVDGLPSAPARHLLDVVRRCMPGDAIAPLPAAPAHRRSEADASRPTCAM